MVSIAVIGFGRMGLSHVSVLRGLLGEREHSVSVFDPSLVSLSLAKAIMPGARVRRGFNAKDLAGHDFVLFTSPPFDRANECNIAGKLSGRIFIEKPIVAGLPSNAMSGYVLQHAPLVDKLKAELRSVNVEHIHGIMRTPIDFSEATGWRSTQFGDIGGEFLGHVVTMALAPLCDEVSSIEPRSLKVISAGVNELTVIFELGDHIEFRVELHGGCKSLRKTSYNVEYGCREGLFSYNLYSIERDGSPILDVAQNGTSTSFYLRGFEYSKQMERLISGQGDLLCHSLIDDIDQLAQIAREQ